MLDLDAKPAAADAVLSLVKLREVHGDLTREYGNFPDKPSREFLAKAAAFQAAASAAGTEISSIDERLEIQSRINFWQSARINAGQRPQTVLLAAFDREAAKRAAGNKAPYKGLAAFQTDDAKNFSGRYEIVVKLVKDVLTHRLLAVIGLSGSGKSSVVRAGLIPQLKEGAYDGVDDGDLTASSGWKYPQPILPGTDPLAALEAVYGPIATPADLPVALDRLGAPVLLSIDQFEEVFTLSEPSERRNRFIDALCAAATSGVHRHMIVITMRSDYIERVKAHLAFSTAVEDCTTVIQSMQASDLRKAIEEPAARLGVGFEPGLVDKLQTSVQGEPAGLPLLSFTLLKLWEMRADGPMKIADYEALGGNPRVILTKSADKLFDDQLMENQKIIRETFTRLVKINDTLDATSNRIKRRDLDVLGKPVAVDPVLQLLLRSNLIRTSPAGDITPATDIEVGHEALIRNWGRLTAWVKESFAEQTNRKAFALRAQKWKDGGGDLLSGISLDEAKDFVDKSPIEAEYVAASRLHFVWRQRRIWAVTAVVAVLAIASSILSVRLIQIGQEKEAANRLAALVTQADSLIDRGDTLLAKKLMLLGLPEGTDPPPAMRAALQAAELNEPRVTELIPTEAGAGAALGMSIAAIRNVPTVGLMSLWDDGRARVWTSSDGGRLWEPKPLVLDVSGSAPSKAAKITAAALSPDQTEATTATFDEGAMRISIQRWTLAGAAGNRTARLAWQSSLTETSAIISLKYSSKNNQVIGISSSNGYLIGRNKSSIKSVGFFISDLTLAIFAPNSNDLLFGHGDGLTLFELPKSTSVEYIDQIFSVPVTKTKIRTARFTDTGARFAAGSDNGTLGVYSAIDGEKLYSLAGHGKKITGVTFSPDSTLLASSSSDGSVRIWDHGIASGRLLRTLRLPQSGNAKVVNSATAVAFTPDGSSLAISTSSGTIRLIDLSGKKLVTASVLSKETLGDRYLSVSRDRRIVISSEITVTDDSYVEIMTVHNSITGEKISTIKIPDLISDVRLAPNGERVAVIPSSPDAKGRDYFDLYRTADGSLISRIIIPPYSFDPERPEATKHDYAIASAIYNDGRLLVFATVNGRLFKWTEDDGLKVLKLDEKHPLASLSEAENPGAPLIEFSRSGPPRFAFALRGQRTVVIHDAATGTVTTRINLGNTGAIETLRFTPDSSGLFVGTDGGSGAIWDAATGELVRQLSGRHGNAILNQTFNDPAKEKNHRLMVVTTSIDNTAMLWDAKTGEMLSRFDTPVGVNVPVWSQNSRYVAIGSPSRLASVWDVQTGRRLTTLSGPLKSGGIVVWFANDDTEVMTLSDNLMLRRWRIATPDLDYDGLLTQACADGGRISDDDIQRNSLGDIMIGDRKLADIKRPLAVCDTVLRKR